MSTPSEEALRREIVATSRALFARGWVANHDGNLSARLADGRLLATPTAVSKGDVEPEWLITLDAAGAALATLAGQHPTACGCSFPGPCPRDRYMP